LSLVVSVFLGDDGKNWDKNDLIEAERYWVASASSKQTKKEKFESILSNLTQRSRIRSDFDKEVQINLWKNIDTKMKFGRDSWSGVMSLWGFVGLVVE
jgi:hypothetical protein